MKSYLHLHSLGLLVTEEMNNNQWNNYYAYGQSAYTLQGQAPYAYAAAACVTTSSSNETYDEDESSDDDTMPWQRHGWIPRSKSGAQKTPNMVRNELQRYVDQCKANGTSNKTVSANVISPLLYIMPLIDDQC